MILGIESSCDESALALYDEKAGIVGEWVHTQIIKHSEYGGVVPDIAVSEHLNNIFPLLSLAREKHLLSNVVNKIAVTCGPGLVGCLGIGISVAKSLGLLWDVPVVGVNHLRGHAFSPFISENSLSKESLIKFLPHLGLLVSGGNTPTGLDDANGNRISTIRRHAQRDLWKNRVESALKMLKDSKIFN